MESKKTTGIIVAVVVLLALVGIIAWSMNDSDETANNTENTNQSQQTEDATVQESSDIVALAAGTESLSTLVTAVTAGELVETLQGDGPFTVFAPTNEAFAALPEGTLDSLLEPANKEQLQSVLTYHVVSGKVMAVDLSNGQEIVTVQGDMLTVEITDGAVYIVDANGGKATVQTADVDASNGVVHVIDSVLLP